MNSPAGTGFFANIRNSLPFGASNQSNTIVQPSPDGKGYVPAKDQLEQKNQNHKVDANGNEINTDPSNSADPNKGATGSQLDSFKDLFKIPVDDKGQPVQQADPFAEPIFKLDPAALSAAASKANFTAGITQEQLQAAQQDPQAMLQLMNKVAQNGFLGAVQSLTGVVEQAVQKNNQRMESALPDRIRKTQISQAQPKHPALSHPAAAPMVEALKTQIATANPHLSPDKVAEMSENYFLSFAGDITNHNQQVQNANKPKPPGEVDWSILGGNGS